MDFLFLARPGLGQGAGSFRVRSLETTSGLASRCPLILETEVDSPQVGAGWLWGLLQIQKRVLYLLP